MDSKNTSATARVDRAFRFQVEMQLFSLDQLLPSDHRARIVWGFVESLDLEPLYGKIEVTGNTAGRSAIAPEILVAVWLQATLDGIGSARELARRCESDIPYLWILGGVSVNHHTLSDFRVQNGEFLEQLLVDTVASLIDQGLVPLETIAQDGMRVRASAGSSSFRRKPSLEKLQREAQEHVERLREETEHEAARQQGEARRRAAHERKERIDEALRQHEKLSEQREKRKKRRAAKSCRRFLTPRRSPHAATTLTPVAEETRTSTPASGPEWLNPSTRNSTNSVPRLRSFPMRIAATETFGSSEFEAC